MRSPGVTVPLNMLAIAALVAVSAFWSGVPLARRAGATLQLVAALGHRLHPLVQLDPAGHGRQQGQDGGEDQHAHYFKIAMKVRAMI